MTLMTGIVSIFSQMLRRRRLNWVEISVERAWSHDMMPRLFDLRGQ